MPIDARIEAARELASDGRFRDAVDLLKEAIAGHPADIDARVTLAELYRERGHPDQAGRWGALVPGWATDAELRSCARLFDPHDPPERIARVLVTSVDALPPALVELIRLHGTVPSREGTRASAASTSVWIGIAAVLVLLSAGVTVFVRAVFGAQDLAMLARGGLGVSLGFASLSAGLWTVDRLARRSWTSSVVGVLVTVALAAGAVALAIVELA